MDDLGFVQRCVNGDKGSWDEFVIKYSRLIYNYIHSVLRSCGQNAAASECVNDIFQEVFCSLLKDNFKKLRAFKSKNGCSLASWLRHITINITIDFLRRSRPGFSLEQDNEDGLSLLDGLADNRGSAKDELSSKERLDKLDDCIERLETDDKYFLELLVNQGLKLEELKNILGISRGACDMRKSRIVDRLRDCFESKGFALDF